MKDWYIMFIGLYSLFLFNFFSVPSTIDCRFILCNNESSNVDYYLKSISFQKDILMPYALDFYEKNN